MALFSTAEAQAFKVKGQTPLASVAAGDITAAHDRIKERFEDICDVAFESTSRTVTLSGTGTDYLLVPNTKLTAVTAGSIDSVALSAPEISALKVLDIGQVYHSSGWTQGYQNVSVTYTHGWTAVPKAIKWAALIVAVSELTQSDVLSRAISQTDDLGSFRLSIPDSNREHWYGIPSVDSVLQQYRVAVPVIG